MKKKETVKSQLGIEVERTEYQNPYVLSIKNLTDEKLFGVKLFNSEYKEQSKVGYSIPFDGIEYQMLLNQINSRSSLDEAIKIGLIRIIALGDYAKFLSKQLNSHFEIVMSDSCGRVHTDPVVTKVDPYHMQSSISDTKYPIALYDKTQIILPYLMPEVEIKIYLFPEIPKQEPLIQFNSKK